MLPARSSDNSENSCEVLALFQGTINNCLVLTALSYSHNYNCAKYTLVSLLCTLLHCDIWKFEIFCGSREREIKKNAC